jgi:hypothetical protein
MYAFMTSALDGTEWLATSPGHFTPGERTPILYPLDRRLSRPQSRSGRGGKKKNPALPGIERRSSSPRPNHCTGSLIREIPGSNLS